MPCYLGQQAGQVESVAQAVVQYRLFIEMFSLGAGRIVSRYPKKWTKLVWDAFEADFGKTASPVDRSRMGKLLKQMTKPVVKRPGCIWAAACDWLTNAESEHIRKPFHAILARNNPRHNTSVLCESEVLEDTAKGWKTPGTVTVPRNAAEMANCVAPMLRCATKILFVDPNFRANRERFRKPLAAFLQSVDTQTSRITIKLHTEDRDDTPSWEEFRGECQDRLPSVIPGA